MGRCMLDCDMCSDSGDTLGCVALLISAVFFLFLGLLVSIAFDSKHKEKAIDNQAPSKTILVRDWQPKHSDFFIVNG